MSDEYNTSSIKILLNEEAEDRWIWKKTEHLAIRYKKPANWINDGLTACYYCNVDLDWFEQRYLASIRFLEVMPKTLTPLCAYFTHIKGEPTGIEFVDSTSLKVCHNLRIERHKTFAGIAKRGRGTMGWFYGFKLHIIVNHVADIVAAKLTAANVDDRKPVPALAQGLSGKRYGDKGYISQALSSELFDKGVELVTNVKKNMKAKLLSAWDRAMLSRRFIIETINDQLKNITQIEHSRHRSMNGFMLNLIGGLIAYCLKESKPTLNLTYEEFKLLVGP